MKYSECCFVCRILNPECILTPSHINAFDLSSSMKFTVSVYDKYTFSDRHSDLSSRKQLEAGDVVSWRDITSQGP